MIEVETMASVWIFELDCVASERVSGLSIL